MLLRNVTEADLPILFEHQRDPESYRMAAFPPRERDAFMNHWRGKVLGDPANLAQAIVVEDEVVGYIASFQSDGRRMIAYWIARARWGQGLATEALLSFLLQHESIRPLFAYVAAANLGSIRVLEKCGFQRLEGPSAGVDGTPELLLSLSARVRAVEPADVPAIAAIYNHYVTHTIVTFEETPVADAEMAERIREIGAAALPWLVAELNGRVVGYAYASPWKTRSAYRFSVETTVYLAPEFGRRGLGTALYAALFGILKRRGVHAAIGGIALPNEGSVALHERFRMQKVAHFPEVGFKQGRWIDVGYWERVLS